MYRLMALAACFIGLNSIAAEHAHVSGRSPASTAQIPVLEGFQPTLRPGQLWMGFPDELVVGLQGDYVNIPIKVASGPNTSREITLAVQLLKRSNQNLRGEDIEILHWLNGYTKNKCNFMILSPGSAHLTMHSTRINAGVPLSKFLRIKLPESAPEGVYLLQFTLTEAGKTAVMSEGVVRLAVVAGMQWGDVPLTVSDSGALRTEIRDKEGLPRSGEFVLAKGVAPDASEVIVQAKSEGPESAIHTAQLPTNWKNYKWRLVIENRGFPRFDKSFDDLVRR